MAHHLALTDKHLQEIIYLLYFFMIFGVIAASISGALRAIEAQMDITGAILLAFISGNAGGTIRDLILGTIPFWVHDQFYIWITLTTGCIVFLLVYFNSKVISSRNLRRVLVLTDAMGLAAFCLAGVEKALSLGQNNVIGVIMGVWTAVGGGIMADVLANRVPLVFSQELYMSVAFIGAICDLFLAGYLHIDHIVASMISAIVMIFLRLYSVKFNWKLPTIKSF